MMTPGQRLDRWERLIRHCHEIAVQESCESRQQTKKLKLYLDAVVQSDAAKRAVEDLPEDSDRKERLLKATEILDQAREELRRTTENDASHRPAE